MRLVKDEDASIEDADGPQGRADKPLSIGKSLAVWALMAALAWAVVASVLHFL